MAILLTERHARLQNEDSMYGLHTKGMYDNAYKIDKPKVSMIGTPTQRIRRGGKIIDTTYIMKHQNDQGTAEPPGFRGGKIFDDAYYTKHLDSPSQMVPHGGTLTNDEFYKRQERITRMGGSLRETRDDLRARISDPRLERISRSGGDLYLGGRGVGGKLKARPYMEGFLQQIPTVFKGTGFTLM